MASLVAVLILLLNLFTFANWRILLLLCYVPHSPASWSYFLRALYCLVYCVCREPPRKSQRKRSHREKHQKNREPGFEMTAWPLQGTGVPGVQGCGSCSRVGGRTLHLLLAVWPPLPGPSGHSGGF